MRFLSGVKGAPSVSTLCTTAAAEGYYRVATIPIGSKFKNCVVAIKAYTATGTVTETTLIVNLAYYASNYSSQASAIFANTSHSYNSQTNAENGYVLLYARVSFDATNAYLDLYSYKATAVTIGVQPLTENDWVWASGALTVNPAVGAYRTTSVTLGAGQAGSSLTASSASSTTYSTYGAYSGSFTVNSTADKTGQWVNFAYHNLSYSASYLKGHSSNISIRMQEVDPSGTKDPSLMDDFYINLRINLAAHTDGATFNAAVPAIEMAIDGRTTLTAADLAVLVHATSTSSKTVRLYLKLKEANTQYLVTAEQRYGHAYSASSQTTLDYLIYVGAAAPIASLPAPAQGVVHYAVMPAAGGDMTKAIYDTNDNGRVDVADTAVAAVNNTSYTASQLHNIRLYAEGAALPTLENGEILLVYSTEVLP